MSSDSLPWDVLVLLAPFAVLAAFRLVRGMSDLVDRLLADPEPAPDNVVRVEFGYRNPTSEELHRMASEAIDLEHHLARHRRSIAERQELEASARLAEWRRRQFHAVPADRRERA